MTLQMRGRAGFTLLEVIIALAISTLVLSGCHFMVTAAIQAREAVRAVGGRAIRSGNISREMRRLVRQFETIDRESITVGDKLNLSQWSWCDGPLGLPDRCFVTLRIRAVSDSSALELSIGGAASIEVPGIAPRRLLYLEEGINGRRWHAGWSSQSLPRAIGIEVLGDTILLPVGT